MSDNRKVFVLNPHNAKSVNELENLLNDHWLIISVIAAASSSNVFDAKYYPLGVIVYVLESNF